MSDDWKIIEAAFSKAIELDEEARKTFLTTFKSRHPALLEQLEGLLAADADDRELLGPIAAAVGSLTSETKDPWLGRSIGPWRLTERIGEGGMGTVFLAQRSDDEYEQTAALKLMTSRMRSRDAVVRFRAERQFLAKLTHPNIAHLLDGGSTDDDQPYLAMEYIEGLPIDQYCDDRRLDVASRLKLFSKVCDAVEYAHRNLIVHRDLKPTNILVDERGEPKLLDFGIAKLLDTHGIEQTQALTREGMLMLTPEYASPEQVRGEPPSITTDVYALGVLLFRLLTGHSPYGTSRLSALELEKAIVSKDPLRPSTIVSMPIEVTDEVPATTAQQLSRQRRTSPERLRKRLVGDLDNVVLKTLQKDPARRYETVAQLRDDVRNFLASRPVIARPDSVGYRARKFLQRNWLPVSAVSIFVLTVGGLISFYTVQLANERDEARLQAERAEQVTDFLTGLFEEASPAKNFGEPMDARELLDTGAAKITDELDDQPELRAMLTQTIANTYVTMRENRAARDFLEPMMGTFSGELGEQDPAYLRLQRELGNATLYVGDRSEAKEILEANYAAWQATVAPDSYDMGIAEQRLGAVYSHNNEPEAAAQHLLTAIDILRDYVDDDPASLTNTMMQYGVELRRQNRFEEEEAVLREAMAIQAQCCGQEQVAYANLVNNLGNNFYTRGMHQRAAAQFREVTRLNHLLFGENGVGYANSLMNLANAMKETGDIEGALETQIRGREIYGRGYGLDSVAYAYASENIANYLMELARYEEAETHYHEAMTILEAKFGTDNIEYAITQSNYGNMLIRSKRNEEGIEQLLAAHKTFVTEYGADNPSTVSSGVKIANGLLNMTDVERAGEYAAAAVEAAKATWQGPHPGTVEALTTLGRTHRDAEDYDSAVRLHNEAISLAKQLDGAPLRPVVIAETDLAKTLIAADREAEALEILERLRDQTGDLDETWDGIRNEIDALLTL